MAAHREPAARSGDGRADPAEAASTDAAEQPRAWILGRVPRRRVPLVARRTNCVAHCA